MQERRSSTRVRSFLGGKIVFNNPNSTIDCLVRNVSSTGARVLLSDTVTIPDEFDLHIARKGQSYRARLAWRKVDEFGVEFIAGAAAP